MSMTLSLMKASCKPSIAKSKRLIDCKVVLNQEVHLHGWVKVFDK